MPLFYGVRGRLKKSKQLNKNRMQELRITEEMDGYDDELSI
jgi:hypothetical protein